MRAMQIGAMPWTQQAASLQSRQLPMQSTSVLGAQQTGIDITTIMNMMIMLMVVMMIRGTT